MGEQRRGEDSEREVRFVFEEFLFLRGCPTQATFLLSVVDARTRVGKMDMEERVCGVV